VHSPHEPEQLPIPSITSEERVILQIVSESIVRSVRSQKAAALAMGVDQGRLSKQLAGIERLPITQIAKCPEILDAFALVLAEARGHKLLPPRAARLVRMAELQESMARDHREYAELVALQGIE